MDFKKNQLPDGCGDCADTRVTIDNRLDDSFLPPYTLSCVSVVAFLSSARYLKGQPT